MDGGIYNMTFTVRCCETSDVKKLENEMWRIRSMIVLMVDTADDAAIDQYAGIAASIERVGH